MIRVIGPCLVGAAVAFGGLATTWRTDRAPAGTSTTSGFAELPSAGLGLLALGVALVALSGWRVPPRPMLGCAAAAFVIAALTGVGGLAGGDGDEQFVGPAPWLFVGGCVAAAVFAVSGTQRPPPPPQPVSPGVENRVRRALSSDD